MDIEILLFKAILNERFAVAFEEMNRNKPIIFGIAANDDASLAVAYPDNTIVLVFDRLSGLEISGNSLDDGHLTPS